MKKDRIKIIITVTLQVIIFFITIIAFYKEKWWDVLAGIIAIFLTFVPLIIKRKYNVGFPWMFNLLVALALAFHLAGQTQFYGFYETRIPYYDKAGHFLGSLTFALFGFVLVRIMSIRQKINLTKLQITIWVLMFSVAIGSMWEMGEYVLDFLPGMNNQKGLSDTMIDGIFNLMGGMFIAMLVYFKYDYMKKLFKVT